MICENCGREFEWGAEYDGKLFCSQTCIDENRNSTVKETEQ